MSDEIESVIFAVMDEYGDASGKILIEDIYRLLNQKHDIDRVSAGKAIIELSKRGKIDSCEYYYLKRL
jgi:Mg2+/Co2+ transporter CorC